MPFSSLPVGEGVAEGDERGITKNPQGRLPFYGRAGACSRRKKAFRSEKLSPQVTDEVSTLPSLNQLRYCRERS